MSNSNYEVVGPNLVEVSRSTDVGAFVELGWTPNGELPSFEREVMTEELGSTELGDEPEQIVYTGQRGLVQFTLAKWDDAVLAIMKALAIPGAVGGDGEGAMGVIGEVFVGINIATSATFSIRFTPLITGRAQRTYPICWLSGTGAIREVDFGNTGSRQSITANVRRNVYHDPGTITPGSGDDLYTKVITS